MTEEAETEFRGSPDELINRHEFLRPFIIAGFVPYLPEFDVGIDFILSRESDHAILRVQLKSRWTVDKKYFARKVWVAFPSGSPRKWYLAPHDWMVTHGKDAHGATVSWERGLYHKANMPSAWDQTYAPFESGKLLLGLTPGRIADFERLGARQW